MAVDFKLKAGDKVALIAPASGQKAGLTDLVEEGVTLLVSWGLCVVILPTLTEQACGYLSASDEVRANDLKKALTEPEIKAIFVTRGGYGCSRMLPLLKDIKIPNHRFLVGFSDITTLHLYFSGEKYLHRVHGPNIATKQLLSKNNESAVNQEALYQMLFNHSVPDWTAMKTIFPDRAVYFDWKKVTYVGGCLSIVLTSLGTSYEIDTRNRVLVIEEVAELPYKIDRLLTQLCLAGKFDKVYAVIMGDMVACGDGDAIEEALISCFSGFDFPVFKTKSTGHGLINLPWAMSQ